MPYRKAGHFFISLVFSTTIDKAHCHTYEGPPADSAGMNSKIYARAFSLDKLFAAKLNIIMDQYRFFLSFAIYYQMNNKKYLSDSYLIIYFVFQSTFINE